MAEAIISRRGGGGGIDFGGGSKWEDKVLKITTANTTVTGSGYLLAVGGQGRSSYSGDVVVTIDGTLFYNFSSFTPSSTESNIFLFVRFSSELKLTTGYTDSTYAVYVLD